MTQKEAEGLHASAAGPLVCAGGAKTKCLLVVCIFQRLLVVDVTRRAVHLGKK